MSNISLLQFFIFVLKSILDREPSYTGLILLKNAIILCIGCINSDTHPQTLSTQSLLRSFESSEVVAMTDSVKYENEIAKENSISVEAGFSKIIEMKVATESKNTNSQTWGTENSQEIIRGNRKQTDVTVSAQSVAVRPRSKLNVTSDFLSFKETINYLVDMEIDRNVHLI